MKTRPPIRALRLITAVALCAGGAPGAGPASAQGEESPCVPVLEERPPEDAFLTDEDLIAEFTGREMEGCYPDGSSWAERTEEGGPLYDLLQGGALVGDWWVEDGLLCYFYPATMPSRADAACWEVIKRDGNYYFFYPGTDIMGGASYNSALIS